VFIAKIAIREPKAFAACFIGKAQTEGGGGYIGKLCVLNAHADFDQPIRQFFN